MQVSDNTWTAAQWRKHEQHQGRLLLALDHYQKIGYPDGKIMEIVRSMMDLNRKLAEREKPPADEPTQPTLGFDEWANVVTILPICCRTRPEMEIR